MYKTFKLETKKKKRLNSNEHKVVYDVIQMHKYRYNLLIVQKENIKSKKKCDVVQNILVEFHHENDKYEQFSYIAYSYEMIYHIILVEILVINKQKSNIKL